MTRTISGISEIETETQQTKLIMEKKVLTNINEKEK
jgi:hypothetical protein